MKLATYQRPLLGLPEFDNLFNGLWLENSASEVRIDQNKDSYRLETDLPGVRKDDLKVNIESDILSVSATRKVGSGENTSELHYDRSFRLPQDVAGDKIAAELQDGVLVITLPKKEESKPRTLSITVK